MTTDPFTVRVHLVDPINTRPAEREDTPPVAIAVDLPLPKHDYSSTTDYVAKATALFVDDAKRIADALWGALPGGTISQLAAELLQRKASLLRVRMPDTTNDTANGDDGPTLANALRLIRDLASDEACWLDHHGGCQEHGYLSLEPGEKCPHQEAKELLAAAGGEKTEVAR